MYKRQVRSSALRRIFTTMDESHQPIRKIRIACKIAQAAGTAHFKNVSIGFTTAAPFYSCIQWEYVLPFPMGMLGTILWFCPSQLLSKVRKKALYCAHQSQKQPAIKQCLERKKHLFYTHYNIGNGKSILVFCVELC